MGHRASFAIREKGQVQVFYSHWGALTVPEDVFWGPEFAEAFIRQNELTDEWLDTVWAEGGAAICKDTKKLAFFGGDRIGWGPERELFLQMMKAIYAKSSWAVEWVDDVRGVAECVGVPGEKVLAAFLPPHPQTHEHDLKAVGEGRLVTLVARRGEDGVWEDRFSSQGAAPWLANGVETLSTHGELPDVAKSREIHELRELHEWEEERPAFRIFQVALIDEPSKTIVSNDYGLGDARLIAHLMERWPGWTISHAAGPVAAFEAMKREPLDDVVRPDVPDAEAKPVPDRDELIGKIAEALLGERSDPVAFAKKAFSDMAKESDGETWTHPSLFVSPPDGRPSRESAAMLFSLAIAGLD